VLAGEVVDANSYFPAQSVNPNQSSTLGPSFGLRVQRRRLQVRLLHLPDKPAAADVVAHKR
jgi:hypothetical protein